MHAISSYRGNRPTNKHTVTHPETGPITIHCAAASAQRIQKIMFGMWALNCWGSCPTHHSLTLLKPALQITLFGIVVSLSVVYTLLSVHLVTSAKEVMFSSSFCFGLFVSRLTQESLNRFSQNSVKSYP